MKKIMPLVLSSILLLGIAACGNQAKTSSSAPNSTEETGEVPTSKTVESNQKDATSKVRRDQLNADIRAREERHNITGRSTERANADLASEVRSKLEANIPSGQLTVTSKNGEVVVAGTVQTQEQLNKIDPLAKEIRGVKSVKVVVKIAPAVRN
ncbi:BON domain-containing protein [Dolichospermum planctonicum CS-1226]|uniref:BON domain-containing protein n=1 Tax=Dolichospermum planctonicum CS-1226 TaxID=3021751 RepID=A0ABT5AC75_9CYAN|nr:BON domain-containing protein [Dolichospermum planctonicum]MDB9534489.1 BON domain-containing protein [Dolichospermum planctonicum CS-1226]